MRRPKGVQEIADVIGEFKASRLVRSLKPCGKRERFRSLYVPKPQNLTLSHHLVSVLGWEDAMALCEQHGGLHLYPVQARYLERAHANREILKLIDWGMTPKEIAARRSISVKWAEAVFDADHMLKSGDGVEVVSHATRISPLMIAMIWRMDVPGDLGPITKRPASGGPQKARPQMALEL